MKEATARSRQVRQQRCGFVKRHMQPSAHPWARTIRQNYVLIYLSLGTESCWNIHALKGDLLELLQLNPQGILFRPLWPPKRPQKWFISHWAFSFHQLKLTVPTEGLNSSRETLIQAQDLYPWWNNCKSICKSSCHTGKNKRNLFPWCKSLIKAVSSFLHGQVSAPKAGL